MISIILYGRNDNYGYNLHKRGALSLNCMAEVLTDPGDEILFVDYNTPDDFPTFPEAIADTLTPRARQMLRIFRVRPRVHARFKARTHLLALEPVARNVALRRSDPANRWILSTNTDMIFVLRRAGSLSEVVRGLATGFYHAPRIEIPEALWETLDRRAPADVIKTVADWGTSLHLNEIVLGPEVVRYDNPGDFQLILRGDLLDNHGFNEDMLLGWHVDANISARMYLKYREIGDLGDDVYGYHCDHTKQITAPHAHARRQNDWETLVGAVDRPDVPTQAATWGCAGDPIEEVRLAVAGDDRYVHALRRAIGAPLAASTFAKYTSENFNKADYDSRHLLPFLADMFVCMPRDLNVAWYGARADTLSLFVQVWRDLGFTGVILLRQGGLELSAIAEQVRHVSEAELLVQADAFVFDFGGLACSADRADAPLPSGRSGKSADASCAVTRDLRGHLGRVAKLERSRHAQGKRLRRVIALNALNNEFQSLVSHFVATAATPFATYLRYGFVRPRKSAWRAVGDELGRFRKRLGRKLSARAAAAGGGGAKG